MRPGIIGTVYRKELRDTLRDRRTLISMFVIPILLFPVLTAGFGALAAFLLQKAQQEGSNIMLLGAEHAPVLAEMLRQTEGLNVVPPSDDYVQQINDKKVRAAVEFPPGFETQLRDNAEPAPVLKIFYYQGELRSRIAVQSIRRVTNDYRDELIEQRLTREGLSAELLTPFQPEEENVASAEKVGGNLAGTILPYFIIILCMTGAIYPAMDLTAGEKERGTIETILASPVGRAELVLGKFLLVFTASVITAVLALSSFAVTLTLAGGFLQRMSSRDLPFAISIKSVAAVFIMILPLAVLFSAALIAIALLAKTSKGAQSYVQPLVLVVILPAIASMLPPKLALVPILNVSLVSKEIFTGNYQWSLIALIFGSSCVYAAAALFVAVRQFHREEVLFRT
jgi:sodium transport system permease protein